MTDRETSAGRQPAHTDLLATSNAPEQKRRQALARAVVNLGLAVNALLAAAKLVAGIVGHSQALLADGINSVSDVVYFIVVRIFVTLSGRPADKEHPYGHHQFETIAALVVGAFVVTTGIAIFWGSINSAFDLLSGEGDSHPVRWFSLWVACATIVIKIALMLHAGRIARDLSNLAVSALARDHRNDMVASAGAALGILGGVSGYPWLDPLAGAIVAILVAKTGIDILRESSADLMDAVPGAEIDQQVRGLLDAFPDVKEVESVHAHRFGPYFMVNITIGIDGALSVAQGDVIADAVESYLADRITMLRRVYVHYHPARGAPPAAAS
jgi:cation diffusion facilitator family transporter